METHAYVETDPDKKLYRTWDGTQQGSPLSPLLFNIYINNLRKYIPESLLDANKSEAAKKRLIMLYADDLFISTPEADIPTLIPGLNRFAQDWDVEFAPQKCIQIGGNKRFGLNTDESFDYQESAKYLGVPLIKTGVDTKLLNSAMAGKVTSATEGILKHVDIELLSIRRQGLVFNTFVRPHIEYAAQIFMMFNDQFQRHLFMMHQKSISLIITTLREATQYQLLCYLLNCPSPAARTVNLTAKMVDKYCNGPKSTFEKLVSAAYSEVQQDFNINKFLNLLNRLRNEKEDLKQATLLKTVTKELHLQSLRRYGFTFQQPSLAKTKKLNCLLDDFSITKLIIESINTTPPELFSIEGLLSLREA
jgi:hypothetical protein